MTEYDIQQFIVRRWHEEGMGSEHDDPIVSVNANTANPHYTPTKRRIAPDQTRRFRAARSRFQIAKAGCGVHRSDLDRLCRRNRSGRIHVASSTSCAKRAIPPSTSSAKMCSAGKSIRGAEVDDVSRGVITTRRLRRPVHSSHRPFHRRRSARQRREHR